MTLVRKFFFFSFVMTVVGAWLSTVYPTSLFFFAPLWALLAFAARDLLQKKHTILRNFPIIGHFRYLFELIRPEIQQYFVESENSGTPVPRSFRSIVYQRAKGALQTVPFGTQKDVYSTGYEWVNHSIMPSLVNPASCRVTIGGKNCRQPYHSSVLNISAMSYGSLSSNAVEALNGGAKIGGFAQNTGEGGISPYHLNQGGDLVFEFGTGYFGVRNPDGTFSPELFKEKASLPQVKMIEIKLSQGAKPGKGGVLPAAKVTPEIAKIRTVEAWKDCHSPARHTAFSTPMELLAFVQKLRELSNGKPIGFKLCVGQHHEFIALCKAMHESKILPDYIVVDGGEGGTGAAPLELTDSVGMPLEDGLTFVVDCLKGFDLKKEITVIAAGKTFTAFHILKKLALGADAVYAARAFMLSMGCIQALRCHSDHCPTGIATHNPHLVRGLVVTDKKVRVARFHLETIKALAEMLGTLGLARTTQLSRQLIYRRVSQTVVQTYAEIFPEVVPGSMLQQSTVPSRFAAAFLAAAPHSFTPQVEGLSRLNEKALAS